MIFTERFRQSVSPLRKGVAVQRTAGGFQPCLHRSIDILAYTFKIMPDRVVRQPQNKQSEFFDVLCANGVLQLTVRLIVLTSVQFDDELRLCTVEVNNIILDHFLPKKADRVTLQKIKPQMTFFPRHMLPKCFCVRCQRGVVFLVVFFHKSPVTANAVPPPLARGTKRRCCVILRERSDRRICLRFSDEILRVSLRLGHRAGLTVHRTVIQYRAAASLRSG